MLLSLENLSTEIMMIEINVIQGIPFLVVIIVLIYAVFGTL